MKLILASASHAEAMAAIHAACFTGADRWNAQAMLDLLDMSGCFGLIHPQGGLILAQSVAGEAEILTLAVLPEVRRHRIGEALLSAALDRTRPAPVFLEVSESNTAALALYANHGFARCGRRPRYYADGSDALAMRRAPPG